MAKGVFEKDAHVREEDGRMMHVDALVFPGENGTVKLVKRGESKLCACPTDAWLTVYTRRKAEVSAVSAALA